MSEPPHATTNGEVPDRRHGSAATPLRDFLARILGFENASLVDRALRLLPSAIIHNIPLVLVGDGDLTSIAVRIHQLRSTDRDPPFVVCDPRRAAHQATARTAASAPSAREALQFVDSVEGVGAISVLWHRNPADFADLLTRLHDDRSRRPLVFICRNKPDPHLLVPSLVIPSLSSRKHELGRILDGYIDDAFAGYSRHRRGLAATDLTWLQNNARSFGEIDRATRRLVAVRVSPSLERAAEVVGMSTTALSDWMERRGLPKRAS